MAAYFLDSSAVVKRYVGEIGTAWVESISSPTAGNVLYVVSVTGVEVVSAISRRRIGGTIAASTATGVLAQFRQDFINQYQTVEISPGVVARAMSLAELHGLRAYDAIQLAAVLETNALRGGLPVPLLTLVSADDELNAAAHAEGVAVEDPTRHP